jgi:hypothetical protein
VQFETYILGLLFAAIALFVRNLQVMVEIAECAGRVKRKLNIVAMRYQSVRALNDDIGAQARENNISIDQSSAEPAFRTLRG